MSFVVGQQLPASGLNIYRSTGDNTIYLKGYRNPNEIIDLSLGLGHIAVVKNYELDLWVVVDFHDKKVNGFEIVECILTPKGVAESYAIKELRESSYTDKLRNHLRWLLDNALWSEKHKTISYRDCKENNCYSPLRIPNKMSSF